MGEEDIDIGFLLKRINVAIGRTASANCKSVTLSQMRVILYLAHQPGHLCSQKSLETMFYVSHPTIVGLIQRLESKGLIETSTDANDRRKKTVHLTSAGVAIAQEAAAHRQRAERQLRKGFTNDELLQLKDLMTRLYYNALEVLPQHDRFRDNDPLGEAQNDKEGE